MKHALLILLVVTLAGCASMPGVTVSPDEKAACEAQTCTVWTPAELVRLARKFYSDGYQSAIKNGAKSL